MTATLVRSPGLGNDVVAHLDAQIASARRLLSAVLRQGQAIRAREVEEVMARLADIQAEMGRRAALDGARTTILTSAGAALGIPPHTVTIESLADLLAPAHASAALARSAELRGLLAEVVREHAINRVLMRQELAFLDHLMRLVGQEPEADYAPPQSAAPSAAPAKHRVLDLQA